MKPEFEFFQHEGRTIIIKGIGKMFYQDGFPISISVSEAKKKGYEVSVLHVADECMKNGWSGKTTYNKISADFQEDIEKNDIDLKLLETFCYSSYEVQRELIFNYLFLNKEEAKQWLTRSLVQTGI